MNRLITLEIPEQIEQDARDIAENTHRKLEDVLTEWLGRGAAELPVDSLSDERVLELSELQMSPEQQDELSDLLARNRENALAEDEKIRLDDLMQIYRRGLVRKAEALKVAVQRGLRSPLN